MRKPYKKTNLHIIKLIQTMRIESYKNAAPIWKAIANRLSGSRKNWAVVNIAHISKHTAENDTVVVPGVLLASGNIDKPVNIAAVKISLDARRKIETVGGKCMSMLELIKMNPKGSKIKIIG